MKSSFLLIPSLILTACTPFTATPTLTPIAPVAATRTATSTVTPSATATLAPEDLAWPTYEAGTLAPFPLSQAELSVTELPIPPAAPNSDLPLALSPLDHFYFQRPVSHGDLGTLISSQRYGVLQEAGDVHDAHLGLDIGLDSRTPVLAAAGGTVIWASYGLMYKSVNYIDDPYGISVVIRHDFGVDGERLYTVYAHLSEAQVEVGERVERGEVIALSGNTGLSTGPHLHFEVRLGTNTLYFTRNPELWIAPAEGNGVLVGRVATTRGALLMNKLVEVRSKDTGKLYTMYTYATEFKLLPDDRYRENYVLSGLPAGVYDLAIPYLGVWRRVEVEITSGAVTYFDFKGTEGYDFSLPAEPRPANLPAD